MQFVAMVTEQGIGPMSSFGAALGSGVPGRVAVRTVRGIGSPLFVSLALIALLPLGLRSDDTAAGGQAVEPSQEAGTHEPAGFQTILEYDGSTMPPRIFEGETCEGDAPSVLKGCVTASRELMEDFGSIIDAPDAYSAGKALRISYPAGTGGGGGNGFLNGWGPAPEFLEPNAARSKAGPEGWELKEIYYSIRYRHASDGIPGWWELNRHGQLPRMKPIGYINVGGAQNAVYPVIAGAPWVNQDPECYDSASGWGCGRFEHARVNSFQAQHPQSVDGRDRLNSSNPRHLFVNVSELPVITVDEWVHVEIWARLNTIDRGYQTNAEMKMWINDLLVRDATNFAFRSAEDPRGFAGVHINPITSGSGARDSARWLDHIDIDHVYVSGLRRDDY